MTVIFTTFQDAGHVGYLLPLVRKLIEDGSRVEFWSGKPVDKWLPEGAEFKELVKKDSGAVPFCMGCSHGPTLKESLEVFLKKASENSLELPENYDLSWSTLHEADELAFKNRLLDSDVELVVDDICHILNWVGPFCHKHGVPNVRFAPSIFFTVVAKQGLMPLFGEGFAAFLGAAGGNPAGAQKPDQHEFAAVRDFAPQHGFFTIMPDFLRVHNVVIDEQMMFENHDGEQCQVIGPLYEPELPGDCQAFRESELKAWCDEAPFVYVSLGSMVSQVAQSSTTLQEDLRILLNALANRRVVINVKLPDYPQRANLKMAGWVPQKAILTHGNLQCFVSHCGQGGVSEAVLADVPIVAYPFFHDQILLAESIEKLGCGVWLQRFDHGPGIPVSEAESAVEKAIAAKQRTQELGTKTRAMHGLNVAHAKIQEFILWSKEHPQTKT
eukprot:TRINITY_DN17824_c0_g2_i1.p1 TRINITY_DN17824_c0_g2~~TRINITY_DN17824_c0_g2_i1.p1  ORF type:complete len:441 (-),score=74.29 TRINITY_DN17824_c0_g2_i1:160-1482(-)